VSAPHPADPRTSLAAGARAGGEQFEIELARAESIAALAINLEATRIVLERHDIPHGLRLLEQARELTSAALLDSQHLLRQTFGSHATLETEIAAMIQTYRSRHNTTVELTFTGERARPAQPAADALVSAMHIALMELASHVATSIDVRIGYDPDALRVTVAGALRQSDFSVGPTARGDEQSSFIHETRLAHLVARLDAIGGTLNRRVDDDHWTLEASVPTAHAQS
jgi:hypothetical protein